MDSVAIVLAVYNSEDFLVSQLESIALQNHQEWNIYIRDDCSNDDSQAIVEKFSRTDDRVHVVTGEKKNLGARDNFASLVEMSELAPYNYVSFSDQDDVWESSKLSMQLNLMHDMKDRFPESALLIHSDMRVVDASLNMIAPSFMGYQGIRILGTQYLII